jgi:hypothetical protein
MLALSIRIATGRAASGAGDGDRGERALMKMVDLRGGGVDDRAGAGAGSRY